MGKKSSVQITKAHALTATPTVLHMTENQFFLGTNSTGWILTQPPARISAGSGMEPSFFVNLSLTKSLT